MRTYIHENLNQDAVCIYNKVLISAVAVPAMQVCYAPNDAITVRCAILLVPGINDDEMWWKTKNLKSQVSIDVGWDGRKTYL